MKEKKIKLYRHEKCSTCKKAIHFLDLHGIKYEAINIVEHPPSIQELKKVLLKVKDIRKLFNTSGQLYRELGLKDKLTSMSEDEALNTLSKEGMLVKRPLLIGDEIALVGFKEPQWQEEI